MISSGECHGKTNESDLLMKCRKCKDVIKSGKSPLSRDKSGRNLLTVQMVTGKKAPVVVQGRVS